MEGKEVPTFVPKDGQIDFTRARWAPVLNTVVEHSGKILLVERNSKLNFYPGYWNGISGFLDDGRSLEEKVKDELSEELGITEGHILSIELCGIFDQEAPEIKKTWIVHAVLARVDTDEITLDWEAQNFAWVEPEKLSEYKLLPGFDQVLKAALGRLRR
jgi:ADP-ribose pyrophosphatase YjhB (NUDIX family)